ncbi:MAG: hypothetical protein CL609_10790 [Anaerolineaceae bacterium]|nr:hypothetical protein [Anaerolineaceae bacterium]
MKTIWIDLKEVLLQDETEQTQAFARNVQNAVEVGVHHNNQVVDVYVPLPEKSFNFIRFGYEYLRHLTDCRSKITKVALHKMVGPGNLSLIHSEDVCLNSERYNFYTFPQLYYPDPCASVNGTSSPCPPDIPFDNSVSVNSGLPVFHSDSGWMLAITINYVDFRDKFVIGPVGLENHLPTKTEISPLDFGAVGDDIADDWFALSQTIAYAQANNLPINLLNRTYAFSNTLEIDKPSGVIDKGLILANGRLHFTNQVGTAIHVGKSRGEIPVVSMENISILGASDIGLDLSRSNNSSFHKVSISGGFSVGLRVLGSLFNDFRDCNFIGNQVNVQISGYEDGRDWVRSNDNNFWSCNLANPTGTAAVYIGELTTSRDLCGSNNIFHSCDFEGFAQRAVVIDGGHGTSFINCRFERPGTNTQIMVLLKASGESTRFMNCWFIVGANSNIALEVESGHRHVKVINSRIGIPQGTGSSHVEIAHAW